MQNFGTPRQPLLGELAMSWRERKREKKNAIYSGHLRLCQQPRAAHTLRSDQKYSTSQLAGTPFLVTSLNPTFCCEIYERWTKTAPADNFILYNLLTDLYSTIDQYKQIQCVLSQS